MFERPGRKAADIGKRIGGGALVLAYALLFLNLPLLQASIARFTHPDASLHMRSDPTPVAAEAIKVPRSASAEESRGVTTTSDEAKPEGVCCCKHAGNVCEMGCCASKEKPTPGEACYRNCGGTGTHQSAVSPGAESHLAASAAAMPDFAGTSPAFPAPVPAAFSPARDPAEKIPIV